LDEFDFAARPSVNKPLVLLLAKGDYLDKRENILLVGPSGTGKSHLATALGMAACAQGRKVRFFRVTELITQLLEAKEERQLLKMRRSLGKLDLLILDELGYVPASKAGAGLLFDVIATAYERNSLIVTTNLPVENWTEVLGSDRLTGTALDRLTHRCQILETQGESYRLQDAKTPAEVRLSGSPGSTPDVPAVDTHSEAPIRLEFFTPSALSFSAARRRHCESPSTATAYYCELATSLDSTS
jgi:DNA replication protein DnaC